MSARPKAAAERKRLAANLRSFAETCEHTEDAEDGMDATFVPKVSTGDFYDTLMDAARLLTAPTGAAK